MIHLAFDTYHPQRTKLTASLAGIVDDILTLSKLDSKLLQIAPAIVQPVRVVQDALKMFESECQRADVTIRSEVSENFHEMGIDWLYVDPSRLLQVLINLLSNAIKFTQGEKVREVTIKMGTFFERPDTLDFVPTRTLREDLTSEAGVGSTFAFFVKARRAQPPESTEQTLSGTISRKSSPLKAANLSILVVEDNLINQNVLCKQLRALGGTG